jgi:hypothetical protein
MDPDIRDISVYSCEQVIASTEFLDPSKIRHSYDLVSLENERWAHYG